MGSLEFHWRKCSVVGAVGAEVWLVQVGGEVNVGYGQESNQVFNTLIKSISNVLNTILKKILKLPPSSSSPFSFLFYFNSFITVICCNAKL